MLKRWRNSHGFGVHSPFGYQIAKRVVCPGHLYSYYAEQELMSAPADNIQTNRHAVKLLRLAAVCGFKCAYSSFPLPQLWKCALREGGCRLNHESRPHMNQGNRILYLTDSAGNSGNIKDVLQSPGNGVIYYCPDSRNGVTLLRQLLESGIIIEGKGCAIAIARLQTQPVIYRMDI